MCWYFCIGFIDSMVKGKSLVDYIDLISLHEYEKQLKRWRRKISMMLFLVSIENLKTLKYQTFLKKQ